MYNIYIYIYIYIYNRALSITTLTLTKVLDPPLITSGLLLTSNKLILCRLLKYKIISTENDHKAYIYT